MLRVEQFGKWASTTHPPTLFWMSGFTFPTGFLTAVLQTAARKNNVRPHCVCCIVYCELLWNASIILLCLKSVNFISPSMHIFIVISILSVHDLSCFHVVLYVQVSVDSLSWEFHVSTLDDSNITEAPKVQDNTYQGVSWVYSLLLNIYTKIYFYFCCDVTF